MNQALLVLNAHLGEAGNKVKEELDSAQCSCIVDEAAFAARKTASTIARGAVEEVRPPPTKQTGRLNSKLSVLLCGQE